MGSTLQIGTSALVALATVTTVLYAYGTLQVKDNINFTPDGTTSGAVLQVNGLTRFQTFPTTCTATGGLTGQYSTCYARSPYTTTGSLLAFSFECGNNFAVALPGDVSFKKSLISGSGAPLTNGDNLTLGSGALKPSVLAVPVAFNPADILTFSTRTTPTGTLSTGRYDCQMYTTVSDKYGT